MKRNGVYSPLASDPLPNWQGSIAQIIARRARIEAWITRHKAPSMHTPVCQASLQSRIARANARAHRVGRSAQSVTLDNHCMGECADVARRSNAKERSGRARMVATNDTLTECCYISFATEDAFNAYLNGYSGGA